MILKGVEKSRKITRCRILLLCHENKSKTLIASMLSINPNTISNTCRRYLEEGLTSAIHEKPRPGAPTIFEGKLRAKITALACSKPPEGYSQWSLRLLSDKAVELEWVESISHTQIGTILKKTK
jgi:transposase